jgi:hypothetical protein
MPLVRNGTSNTRLVASLTERLSAELHKPRPDGLPLVLENQIAQTAHYHVTVIWDAWQSLPLGSRSRVILDAYGDAFPEKTGKVAIAQGLTMPEAVSMGLFPFKVIALPTRGEAAVRERAGEALRRRGAINGPHGLELRFRTLDEADRAFTELKAEVPGDVWSLVEETNQESWVTV